MTTAPQRRSTFSLRTLFVVVTVSLFIYGTVDFVLQARQSGNDDRIRVGVRTGQLDPEAGRGILGDAEIEQLKSKRLPQ